MIVEIIGMEIVNVLMYDGVIVVIEVCIMVMN